MTWTSDDAGRGQVTAVDGPEDGLAPEPCFLLPRPIDPYPERQGSHVALGIVILAAVFIAGIALGIVLW